MTKARRKRLRLSPLFVRFGATPVAGKLPSGIRAVARIDSDEAEWYLHPTKGWRKRAKPKPVEVEDEIYEDDEEEDEE